MRRALAGAALCAGALAAAAPALAQAPEAPRVRLIVAGLPQAEARALAERRPAALGLGVYPESRRSEDFLRQIGFGAPPASGPAIRSGRPGALRRALDAAGVSVGIAIAERIRGAHVAALADAFSLGPPAPTAIDEAIRRDVAVVVLDRAEDVIALRSLTGARALVIGADDRTPALVAVPSQDGVLTGGIARRPGIVTPYDVAATVLDAAGVPRGEGFVGNVLRVEAQAAPLQETDTLAARMQRDTGIGFGITFATVAFAAGSLLVAAAFRRLVPNISARLVQAAAWVQAGYLGALFVPHEDPAVRSAAVFGAFVIGVALPPRRLRAVVAVAGLGVATAVCVLSLVAAARPGGEPALSLWGDPVESWRFFGLRNHMIAFLVNGIAAATALVAVPGPALAVIGLGFLLIAGAPVLGANFVGVLVLGIAIALALLARGPGRVRLWHLAGAAVAGAALFAAALAADAAADATHGGRAVASISSGGADAAWDIVRHRVDLNWEEIRDFYPPGGYALAGVEALGFLGVLLLGMRRLREGEPEVWAVTVGTDMRGYTPIFGRRREFVLTAASERTRCWRAGIAAAAAGGLAMLALEDSGVLAAAIVGFGVLVIAAVPWVERAQERADLQGELSRRSDVPPPGGA